MDSDASSVSQFTEYSRNSRSNLDKGAYFGKQFRDVLRTSLKAKTRPSSARGGTVGGGEMLDNRVMKNDYTKNMSSSIHYPGA